MRAIKTTNDLSQFKSLYGVYRTEVRKFLISLLRTNYHTCLDSYTYLYGAYYALSVNVYLADSSRTPLTFIGT